MKINQNGRSMVEMLGVLAIIGVLSVGAIAGYSKAMHKYKFNKLRNQVVQVITNIQTWYMSVNKNTWTANVLNKLIILPEMGTVSNCRHAMGGRCYIGINQSARKYIKIGFQDLSYEVCLDLATLDLTGIRYSMMINALNNTAYDGSTCSDEGGNNKCFMTSQAVTIDKIKDVCGQDKNAIVWYFSNDLED